LAPRLRVLAFDLRGRGLSDSPDTGYSMADHAADMLGAMDALGIERVALGGHSFGGLLTYYLAAHHPERVERAVVMDAPAVVDPTIIEQIQPSLDRLERHFQSWDEYLAMVRQMPYYDGWEWQDELTEFYRSDVEVLDDETVRSRCRPGHIGQAVEGTLQIDWPALVATISQPTLLIRAAAPFGPPGYPPIVPEDKAQQTLALLQDGRLVTFEGNHITFLFGEGAADVADTIVEFVTK
ncbi:MAG: alpha/beta hydrolase, partial [Actinomycetota bacterium]|nr:alpha/beta hydrolase [Actinomycetota bacterium]